MQMTNSNGWELQSIPGLTRKRQENSNLKKEEENTEQLPAFSKMGQYSYCYQDLLIWLAVHGAKLGSNTKLNLVPKADFILELSHW